MSADVRTRLDALKATLNDGSGKPQIAYYYPDGTFVRVKLAGDKQYNAPGHTVEVLTTA